MACASRTVFREDNKTMWLMRCEICTEDFSEEHKPVVLSCSHSFCLTCLTRIIESRDKRCPDCGQNIKGNSSADLTINRNLLDLVKYLKQKKGLHIPPEPAEDVWKMAEVNRHHWKQAEREIREMVLINAKKIKKLQNTNTILAHDLKLKVDPIVMENRKLIQKLHGYNAGMIRDTDLVTEMQAVASIAKERAKRAKNFTESGRMKDSANRLNKFMQICIKETMAHITDNKALHQKIEKDTPIELRKIQEILRLIHDTDVVAESLSIFIYITVNDLKRTTGEVYAVKIMNGKRRYSRIVKSDKDGRILHVHRLKDERNISPNAQFIQYDEITELTHYSDRMTFMDLGSGGESLVRIVIKYYNDINFLNHVKNHILLCTGERGPSYVNSKVLEARDKGRVGEFLILGDFEKNDGTAGRAVVSSKEAGFWWDRGDSVGMLSSYLCQHGSTEATASQFSILTKKFYGAKVFAYVKEGLSTLSSVIRKCDNVREIEIIDCGRVVYC